MFGGIKSQEAGLRMILMVIPSDFNTILAIVSPVPFWGTVLYFFPRTTAQSINSPNNTSILDPMSRAAPPRNDQREDIAQPHRRPGKQHRDKTDDEAGFPWGAGCPAGHRKPRSQSVHAQEIANRNTPKRFMVSTPVCIQSNRDHCPFTREGLRFPIQVIRLVLKRAVNWCHMIVPATYI